MTGRVTLLASVPRMMALLVVVPSATGVTGAFLFGFLAEEVRSDPI